MITTEPPIFFDRIKASLFIIIFTLSIFSLVLTLIDKSFFDLLYFIYLLLSILLLISIGSGFFIKKVRNKFSILLFIINGILWITNIAIFFFAYQNTKETDFFSIGIFLTIFKCFVVFASIGVIVGNAKNWLL